MTRRGALVTRTLMAASVVVAMLVGGRVLAAPDHSSSASRAALRATHATTLVAWKPRAWVPAAPVESAPAQHAAVIPAEPPVRIERRSNGMLIAHLDERYAEYMMVTVGPDGTPSASCVHGSQGVASFLKQALVKVTMPSPMPEDK